MSALCRVGPTRRGAYANTWGRPHDHRHMLLAGESSAMSGTTGRTVLTFLGRTPPIGQERAVEILRHVDEYQPPSRYTRRLSMVDDRGRDAPTGLGVMWSDHMPSDLDVLKAEPHIFRAAYDTDGGCLSVGFKTDLDTVPEFFDVLEHLFVVTDIRVGGHEDADSGFTVEFASDSIVGAGDIDTPVDWVVEIRRSNGGSRVELHPFEGFVLDDSNDPLVDAVETARSVVEEG